MEIRPLDVNHDLDAVLDILGRSLKHPGNREWFQWKHQQNPFGSSPGFVAEENGKILGVRLFMRWEFRKGNDLFTALRPVDTATHPDARGKGIFRKLTLDALELLNKDNDHIIFNTPNGNSLPGYLKMGWKPFHKKLYGFYFLASPLGASSVEHHHNFGKFLFMQANTASLVVETNKTEGFFTWRYNPSNYQIASLPGDQTAFMVYKVQKKGGLAAIVIKDYYGPEATFSPLLKAVARHHHTFLVHAIDFAPYCTSSAFGSLRRAESVVVYRGHEELQQHQWRLSPGDLEGIL